MTQKQFLVESYRITADVTVKPYPGTTAGDVTFYITSIDSTKPTNGKGFGALTSGERELFYNQVLAFACTLPHGFPSLRPLADAPLPPTLHGFPYLV